MLRFPQRLVLSGVACALVVGLGLAAWGLTTGSSGAASGTMQNCPAAGKWSIAVWDGASGTTAADALAMCGADAVDAAYALDTQTGAWTRWFAGKPAASNMPPFSDIQGVLALGSAPSPTPTPTPTATKTATATPTSTPTGETGYLPPPQEVGHISAGGKAVVTTSNDTPYTLTLEFNGPTNQTLTIARCDSCHVYSLIGPLLGCPSGRPEETVNLPAGTYTVTAHVDDPSIVPFVGDWTLEADTEYFQCFYIVTTFG
jgi:hypothetical protein